MCQWHDDNADIEVSNPDVDFNLEVTLSDDHSDVSGDEIRSIKNGMQKLDQLQVGKITMWAQSLKFKKTVWAAKF